MTRQQTKLLLTFVALIGMSFGAILRQSSHWIDSVTAATTKGPAASFATSILQGPDVTKGVPLIDGQPVSWLLTVTNPWPNNRVSMEILNPQTGMSLTQRSTSQGQPSWQLSWTPDGAVVGAISVQFRTTFVQDNGIALAYNQPVVNVKVAGSGSQAAAMAISTLTTSKATWNAKTGVLSVAGQIKLIKGMALPAATLVSINYANGSPLPSPNALINNIKPNGQWSGTISLIPGTNPCSIEARVVVGGLDTPATASRKVTGTALGCQ